MSKASEELVDVRGWLCNNLSKGDAGKVCGMLSVVSRHIVELEDENAKLRELLLDCWDFSHLMHGAMAARFYELGLIDDGEARELGIEVTQ